MPPGTSQQPTMIQSQSATAPAHNSGRLKYADPRDLPSFPSTGLRPDGAAASAAASLGWSNQKPIELWKPDKTSSASAAAALAKNYKMAPSWEPTSNSAGQQAALLAVGSANAANKSSIQRKSHEGWGSSAANQAFNANRSNSIRQVHQTTSNSSLQGQKSLAAAKGAMATTRRRAQSTPTAPPGRDPLHPGASTRPDALSGATLAHKASLRSKPSTESAGAVPITTMTRNMFTSHPPVKPEVDERKTNEQLHATAVAMARKMYTQQQKMIDQAKDNQGQDSDVAQPKPYINLQDAAYKQAQERLAKLEEEHQKNRDLQGYYGNSPSSRRRFMLTSKLRRRSSSDGDLDDRQQSEKIRQQMSLFSNKLSEVDEKKRAEDRNILLAAAQRNVKARLQGMDEKVYHETGMVNPTLMNEWELKAHQVATASHDARNENKGKVDIGGGKFMDPHEVNTIAAKRVKPVLDDINEKAEAERERLATLKLEEEAKKAEQEKQKAREREIKEITKKLKEQEKQEYKTKKAEEKAARAEEKRHAKEEKRRSRGDSVVTGEEGTDDHASTRSEEAGGAPVTVTEPTERPTTMRLDTDTSNTDNQRKMSDSGMSPTSKVKGWIRNRFSRGKSLGEKDRETHGDKRRSFIGGAALRGSDLNHSTTSLDNRPSSMRDVAFAGRSAEAETSDAERKDSRGVSPVSTLEDLTTDRTRGLAITPPPAIEDPAVRETPSPSRDSRFKEMMDQ